MIRRGSASEQHLGGLPMPKLGREIKRHHFVTPSRAVFVRARLQKGMDVFGSPESGREHQRGDVAIVLDVIAKRF